MAAGAYAAAAGAGLGALGGVIGARSANRNIGRAGDLIGQYGNRALSEYTNALSQMTSTLNPYMQLGERSMGDTEAAARRFVDPTLTGFNMQNYFNDPGYQFQLQQGQQGINNAAAARGNFFSPATMQALGEHQQGLAATGFQDAFQRYMQEQQGRYGQEMGSQQQYFNQLSSILGLGANATGQLAQGQYGTGQARGGTQMQIGSDLANLQLGRQNPWAAGIQGAVSGAGAGFGAYKAFQ